MILRMTTVLGIRSSGEILHLKHTAPWSTLETHLLRVIHAPPHLTTLEILPHGGQSSHYYKSTEPAVSAPRAAETAQWLRGLTVLAESKGLVPSSKKLTLITPVLKDPMPSSACLRHLAHAWYIYRCANKTPKHTK